MKAVHEGEIIEALPVNGGIVVSYVLGYSDDKMKIAYKMLSLSDGKITNVASSVYKLAKFGANYRAFETQIKDVFTSRVIILQNGREFVLESNGKAKILDTDATEIWNGVLTYDNAFPSSVAVCGGLWAVYPQKNVLIRYNTVTMREELRIGGKNSEIFNCPISISTLGNSCIVCNLKGQSVVKVNAETFDVEVYKTFENDVYNYINSDGYEFIQFENGIYLI